jgi:hypothetical protein
LAFQRGFVLTGGTVAKQCRGEILVGESPLNVLDFGGAICEQPSWLPSPNIMDMIKNHLPIPDLLCRRLALCWPLAILVLGQAVYPKMG